MLRGGGDGEGDEVGCVRVCERESVCVCVCVLGGGIWIVVGRYAVLQLCVCLSMSE